MKISSLSHAIIKNIFIICLICIILGYFFIKPYLYYVVGLIFGSLASAIKLICIEYRLNKAIKMKSNQARIYVLSGFMLRYLFTFIIIVISTLIHKMLAIGIIIGLIILQLSVYTTKYIYSN